MDLFGGGYVVELQFPFGEERLEKMLVSGDTNTLV